MAYERNWAFSFDNAYIIASALDYTRWQVWSWKALLCGQLGGLTLGLWSVYSSSDGSTAGNGDGPGVDRWTSTYNGSLLVRAAAGSAHSWVVLKSPLMNGINFYLTISLGTTNDAYILAKFSKVAPTGGTTTADPTASDSWTYGAFTGTVACNVAPAANTVQRSSICLSSVGDFIFINTPNGYAFPHCVTMAIAPVGCHPNDRYPIWNYAGYSNTAPGGISYTTLSTQVNNNNATRTGSVAVAAAWECLICMSAKTAETPDLLTGKRETLPSWVMVNAGATTEWHQRGRLPDIFVVGGNSVSVPVGPVLMDGGGNPTHVFLGNLVVPANAVPNFA
jgi:hypothetical protein